MADSSDVNNVLVGLLSSWLYPTGTANPSAATADIKGIRIYVGWPVQDQVDADLANAICHVSVYALPVERNTTRYLQRWQPTLINTPTLTLTVAGQTVTVGGTIPPANNPHNAVIFVNNVPFVYPVQPTDTQAGIAAALATLIRAIAPATVSSGPMVTIPMSARLGAVRIGVTGTSVKTIASQEKQFQVGIWTDTPTHRTSIATIIDPALKALTFLTLADFTRARIRSFGSRDADTAQKQSVYSRMLIYTVDYATTLQRTDTQVTQVQVNVTPQGATSPAVTVYE